MVAISAILSIYLKSVFVFFILNGVATACCMSRIEENGWFEIGDLREGLTPFEILTVSAVPIVRAFFFFGIIAMYSLNAEEYYKSKYGDYGDTDWEIEEEEKEDNES